MGCFVYFLCVMHVCVCVCVCVCGGGGGGGGGNDTINLPVYHKLL